MEFQVLFTGINQCLPECFWLLVRLDSFKVSPTGLELGESLLSINWNFFPFSFFLTVTGVYSRVAVCSRVRNFWFFLWMSLCVKFVFCLSSLVCLGLFSRLSFFLNSVFFSSAFFANNVLLDMLRNRTRELMSLNRRLWTGQRKLMRGWNCRIIYLFSSNDEVHDCL